MARVRAVVSILVGALVTLTLLGGCGWLLRKPVPETPPPGEARQIVERFVEHRLRGDRGEARALLTEGAQRSFDESEALRLDLAMSNPHVMGYRIVGEPAISGGDEAGVVFTVRFRETYTGQPYAGRWDEHLRVVETDNRLLIDDARFENSLEVIGEEQTLSLIEGEDRSTLLTMEEVPDVFRPQGADEGVEFGVGNQGFGPLAFSPEGGTVFFSTWGTHGFAGMVTLSNRQVRGIDLYYGGGVVDLVPSPTEEFLAVEILTAGDFPRVRVYRLPEVEVVSGPLDDELPAQQYSLPAGRWV